MEKVKQSFEIISPIDGEQMLKEIELAGRTCYKSEDKITENSAKKLVSNFIKWGHESPLEHKSITVKIITDRGILAELTRHRLASYNVESTRYVRYGAMSVVPCSTIEQNEKAREIMDNALKVAEKAYMELLDMGYKAQDARDVLPTCLKTEIVCTANLREWRHIFKLRTDRAAHPKIREIMIDILKEFKKQIPVVFDDIEVE